MNDEDLIFDCPFADDLRFKMIRRNDHKPPGGMESYPNIRVMLTAPST